MMTDYILAYLYWDPSPDMFRIPGTSWPILWYGFFFALGFFLGFPIFVSLVAHFLKIDKKRAVQFTDQLTLYMVIGTVVGARLGHLLFYEKPQMYLKDPWIVFRVWEGGLASHGAVAGILVAIFLFWRQLKPKFPHLKMWSLLDWLTVPTALCAFFIRIGNFFNQEILGTKTHLPWAVIFGHPQDGSFPAPRHPVQLYEAFFYLAFCPIFWRLTKISFFQVPGRLVGLLLITFFSFRIFIETMKVEQSSLWKGAFMTMGGLLSLPLVVLGIYLLVRKRL